MAHTARIAGLIQAAALFLCSYHAAYAEVSPNVMRAACRAQSYLQKNGYLRPIDRYDEETLHIDILDRMTGKGAEEAILNLLKEREGTFINKLYGVAVDETYSQVAYRFGAKSDLEISYFLRCVVMENEGDWITLIHQDCIDGELVPISEAELAC